MPGARLSASTERTSGALRCRRLLGHRPEAPGTRSRRSPRYQDQMPGCYLVASPETLAKVRQPISSYPDLGRGHAIARLPVRVPDGPLNQVLAVLGIRDATVVHHLLIAEVLHQDVLAGID